MTKTTEADAGCYKVIGTNDAGTAECIGWMAVFGRCHSVPHLFLSVAGIFHECFSEMSFFR